MIQLDFFLDVTPVYEIGVWYDNPGLTLLEEGSVQVLPGLHKLDTVDISFRGRPGKVGDLEADIWMGHRAKVWRWSRRRNKIGNILSFRITNKWGKS